MSIQRFDKDNKDTGPLIEWRYGYWVPYHEYEKLEKQLTGMIIKSTRCMVADKVEIRKQCLAEHGIMTDMWMPGCPVYVQRDRTQNIIHFNEWTPDQLRAIADHMEEK